MKLLSKKENPYLSDPDVRLMLRFKAGDQSALESLMRKYYPRILNFIYRFLGNQQIAEDLTQEVFLKIHKSAFKYKPRSKFKTWLYTIAKNTALNELRRKRGLFVSTDQALNSGVNELTKEIGDYEAVPEKDLIHKEKMAKSFAGEKKTIT